MSAQRVIRNVKDSTDRSVTIGPAPADAFVPDADHPMQVTCEERDGVITRITVQCQCGRTIQLQCEYEA